MGGIILTNCDICVSVCVCVREREREGERERLEIFYCHA